MLGEGIVGAGVAVHGANDGDVVGPELGLRATEHHQQQHERRQEHGRRSHRHRHCGHGLSELGIIIEKRGGDSRGGGQIGDSGREKGDGEMRQAEANKRM